MNKLMLFFIPLFSIAPLYSTFREELEARSYDYIYCSQEFERTLNSGNKERGTEVLTTTKTLFGEEVVNDILYNALLMFERIPTYQETYLSTLLAHDFFQYYAQENSDELNAVFSSLPQLAQQRHCSDETIALLDALLKI